MNELEHKLTPNELKLIKELSDDDFYFKNSNEFDDMFDELKEYCDNNYLMIFDKCTCSFELTEFIKEKTKILNNIYKRKLLEEIEYQKSIENSYERINIDDNLDDDIDDKIDTIIDSNDV
jgi:hypothetical protein